MYAIYVVWRNAITRLVATRDEFRVPVGGASRLVLVMIGGRNLETIGVELVCLSVCRSLTIVEQGIAFCSWPL